MNSYTIKELSNMFHVRASTLRYYEEIGLLTNVKRTEQNQRLYTEEHIARLNAVSCFKNTGLPISKMQDFFRYEAKLEENIDNIIELVTEQEKNLKEHMKKMQEELAHIEHKVRYYNGIKKAIDTNEVWPCWEDFSQP